MSEDEQGNADDEEEEDEINTKKFKMGKIQDAMSYPRWMERVALGSKTPPASPCMIGVAQPDLIKILLLQIGRNLYYMIKHFQLNFCGKIEVLWKYFNSNSRFRVHLDRKVPYLGVDHEGNFIEPSDDQMRELYRQVGNPGSKEDIGEDGFVNAYHGSLIFKTLVTYLLECGYASNDLKEQFGGEQFEGLHQDDTPEEEARKTFRARDSLEMQATFVRRVIAGAFGVNAVYFFRAVNYENTIYIDPVDIICACRPQLRRVAVLRWEDSTETHADTTL